MRKIIILLSLLSAQGSLYAGVLLPTTSIMFLNSGIPTPIKDAVWDPVSQRFFLSLGRNFGSIFRVAVINPTTAIEEASIPTGDVPNHLAISGDGQYLYVGFDEIGVIRRYVLSSRTMDLEIRLPKPTIDTQAALAILVVPNQPETILVVRGDPSGLDYYEFVAYDHGVPRPKIVTFAASIGENGGSASLYIRPSNGMIYGFASGYFFSFRWMPLA